MTTLIFCSRKTASIIYHVGWDFVWRLWILGGTSPHQQLKKLTSEHVVLTAPPCLYSILSAANSTHFSVQNNQEIVFLLNQNPRIFSGRGWRGNMCGDFFCFVRAYIFSSCRISVHSHSSIKHKHSTYDRISCSPREEEVKSFLFFFHSRFSSEQSWIFMRFRVASN